MVQEVSDRLEELREEFEMGQRKLEDLESQAASVRNTLPGISGAVQVLEELLSTNSAADSKAIVPEDRKCQAEQAQKRPDIL
jgi:prefoldin subunit 5